MFMTLRKAIVALLLAIVPLSPFAHEGKTLSGIFAKSYIVLNSQGQVVLEKDSKTPRPIASITKLLVAEQLEFILSDAHFAIRPPGKDVLSEAEMMHLALIVSSNISIIELARRYGNDNIINGVNTLAKWRGLNSIFIDEPSGLSQNNVASAQDLAKFLMLVKDSTFAKVSTFATAKIPSQEFKSTNPFIGKHGWNFKVSKTGFINAAGGCLATIVEIGGEEHTVVLLGSANVVTRWYDLTRIRLHLSNDNFWTASSQPQKQRKK